MTRKDPQLNLRLPADLKDMLEQAAEEHNRSVTAETVERLRQSFSVDKSSTNTMFVLSRYEVRIAAAEAQVLSHKLMLAATAQSLESAIAYLETAQISDPKLMEKIPVWKEGLNMMRRSGIDFEEIERTGFDELAKQKSSFEEAVNNSGELFLKLTLQDQKKITKPEDHPVLEEIKNKKK